MLTRRLALAMLTRRLALAMLLGTATLLAGGTGQIAPASAVARRSAGASAPDYVPGEVVVTFSLAIVRRYELSSDGAETGIWKARTQ